MAAEAIVSTLSEKLTSWLADKIFQEAFLVINFREDVEFICEQLDSFKTMLNNVREMTKSSSTTSWLHKVEDFLYRAMDIVEECEARKFRNPFFRWRMGRRIKALKKCVTGIHSNAQHLKYLKSVADVNAHFHALNANSEFKSKKSTALLTESTTVGMESDIKLITNWILQEGSTLIAVVGNGGMGKTLVLQNVLNNQEVEKHFNHVVWLAVSQQYIVKELLLEMGRQIKLPTSGEDLSVLEVEKLRAIIHEHLVNKRWLLILDDVWAQDALEQIGLQQLQSVNNESVNNEIKIVVSTRDKRVGEAMGTDKFTHKFTHEMKYLTLEESLHLFYVHAFPNVQNDPLSEEMKQVSKPIVQKCRGLPLALKRMPKLISYAIGSLMRSQIPSLHLFYVHAFPNLQNDPLSEEMKQVSKPSVQKCGSLSLAIKTIDDALSEEMKQVSKRIVQKCGGLPLAIKTIAASLARVERMPNMWESTLQRLNQAEALTGTVMPSLRLSYCALPYHLKSCFLYCSVFPKNTEMRAQYLVYSWIAEGFVPTPIAADAYDIGLSYIQELADRCLLEVSKVGGDGRIKYCKIHALLHDLALSESQAGTKCLLKPGEKLEEFPSNECLGVRRISLVKNNIKIIKDGIPCPQLRTLLLWNNTPLTSISTRFFNKLRYLAVLDLSQTKLESLPRSISNLKHLKFLNLSRTKIVKLPSSLSGLWHLQFLDVSWCKHLTRLHSGIGEHKFMLHLNVKRCKRLESLPAGIAKLSSLQTLKGAIFRMEKTTKSSLQMWKGAIFRMEKAAANVLQLADLKKLTLLQHLSMTIDVRSSSQAIEASSSSPAIEASSSSQDVVGLPEGTFEGMTKLRTVSVRSKSSGRLDLPKDMEFIAQRLEHVRLHNCSVPKWIFHLQNLMVLVLDGNNSGEDYIGLQKIPNLRKLRLSGNEECEAFPEEFGTTTAFPNLKKLMIEDFQSLTEFPHLQGNAMSKLQYLRIKNCNHNIDIMHQEFDRLETLREVEVEKQDYRLWEKSKERHVKIKVINPSEEKAIEKAIENMVKDAIQKEMVEDKSVKRPRRTISEKVLDKIAFRTMSGAERFASGGGGLNMQGRIID